MHDASDNAPLASQPRDLPWWVYLPLPLLLYPVIVVLAAFEPLRPYFGMVFYKEGPIEWVGVIALLIGIIVGITTMVRHRHRLPARWLRVWFGLVLVAMFFLAGEEISWGQHLGLWDEDSLPGWLTDINDQNETNLHNIGGNFLDVNPTNLVVLATLVGCVIIPIYLRVRGRTMPPDDPGHWFWPTHACLPAGLGVLLIRFPHRIYRWSVGSIPDEIEVYWRHSEVHEVYIALLFTVYILSMAWRLRQTPIASTP